MYFLWWLELIAWMKSRVSVLGHSPSEVLAGVRLSFFHVICLQYFFLLCCSGLTNQMLVWHQPLLFWLFLNLWHFFPLDPVGLLLYKAMNGFVQFYWKNLTEQALPGVGLHYWIRMELSPAGSAQWTATSCAFHGGPLPGSVAFRGHNGPSWECFLSGSPHVL